MLKNKEKANKRRKRRKRAHRLQSQRKRPVCISAIIGLAIVCLVVLVIVLAIWPKQENVSIKDARQSFNRQLPPVDIGRLKPVVFSDETSPAVYTLEELHQFYDEHMKGIVEPFFTGQFHILEIKDRVNGINSAISEMYGGQLTVTFMDRYDVDQHATGLTIRRYVYADSGLKQDGVPHIRLYIPAFVNFHKRLESGEYFERQMVFESHVVICLMHELEHLRLGHILIKHPTPEEHIAGEAEVRALVCEETMKVLAETYSDNTVVGPYFWKEYLKWFEAGRNVNSPIWQEYISVNLFHK